MTEKDERSILGLRGAPQWSPSPHGTSHDRQVERSPAVVGAVGPGGGCGQMQPELALVMMLPLHCHTHSQPQQPQWPQWPCWPWAASRNSGRCPRSGKRSSSRARPSYRWIPSHIRAQWSTQETATVELWSLGLNNLSHLWWAAFERRRIDTLLFWLLASGSEGDLTKYTFNRHKAQHTFCKRSGVQNFYTPCSNPRRSRVAPTLPGWGHCQGWGHWESQWKIGRRSWKIIRPSRTCLKSELLLLPSWKGGMIGTNSFAVCGAHTCGWPRFLVLFLLISAYFSSYQFLQAALCPSSAQTLMSAG